MDGEIWIVHEPTKARFQEPCKREKKQEKNYICMYARAKMCKKKRKRVETGDKKTSCPLSLRSSISCYVVFVDNSMICAKKTEVVTDKKDVDLLA